MADMLRATWWGWWVIALFVFVLLLVPYLLPLGGPPIVAPATLADDNGAFVEIDGETMYYVHARGGEHGAVLLIHGFGGSTVTWQQTVPALAAAGYDVYAVDLPGFGLSQKGWETDYRHSIQAQRVIGLMDRLGVDRAAVVGHSMGGSVAVHLALAAPERISRLVLVDAALFSSGSGRFSAPGFVLDVPVVRRWAQFGLRRSIDSLFTDLLYDAAYQDDAITPALEKAYKRALHTPGWDTGLLGILRDARANDLPAPVSTIRIPTLIMWGAEDTWVAPADGVRLEGLIAGAQRIEFPGVGHLPMHEAPEDFNAALLSFLGEAS